MAAQQQTIKNSPAYQLVQIDEDRILHIEPSPALDRKYDANNNNNNAPPIERPPVSRMPSVLSSISSLISRPREWVRGSSGVPLALISGLLMTFYSALYKQIKNDINRTTVLVVRGLIQTIFFLVVGLVRRVSLRPKGLESKTQLETTLVHTTLAAVAVVGGLRLCFIFMALQLASLSTVHTILYSNPIVVMLLSHFCLASHPSSTSTTSERCSPLRFAAALGLIAGLVLTFQPYQLDLSTTHDIRTVTGILFSMLALFSSATGSVLTKRITAHHNKLYISSVVGVAIIVFGLVSDVAEFSELHQLNAIENSVAAESTDAEFNHTEFVSELAAVERLVEHAHADLSYRSIAETNLTCVLEEITSLNGTTAASLLMDSGEFNGREVLAAVLEVCRLHFAPYFPRKAKVWVMAIVVGFMGAGQQFFLIAALERDSPSRVTMVRSLQILLTFLVQLMTPGEDLPGVDQVMGALIVLAAIMVVAMETRVNELIRTKCGWKAGGFRSRANSNRSRLKPQKEEMEESEEKKELKKTIA